VQKISRPWNVITTKPIPGLLFLKILTPAFDVFAGFLKSFCQVTAGILVENQNTKALDKGEYEDTAEDGTPKDDSQNQLRQYSNHKEPFSPS
jgi:hypothetical protein